MTATTSTECNHQLGIMVELIIRRLEVYKQVNSNYRFLETFFLNMILYSLHYLLSVSRGFARVDCQSQTTDQRANIYPTLSHVNLVTHTLPILKLLNDVLFSIYF